MKILRVARSIVMGILISTSAFGQVDTDETEYLYLITFKDKSLNYVRADKPETYLTQKALDRRKKFNIPVDSLDYPVSKAYIGSLKKKGLKVLYPTRWLNGAVVSTKDKENARRSILLFYVDKVYYLGERKVASSNKRETLQQQSKVEQKETGSIDANDPQMAYAEGYEQLQMINGIDLHKQGYTGEGVTIAVFDAGFYNVDQIDLFSHLFKEDRIRGTFDFIQNNKDVYEDDNHGLHVFTCLAANKTGLMIGSAPDADYYLFRTEDEGTEYLIEEIAWVRAAEVADSIGVDIINSSLGYTYFDDKSMDHTWKDLGGTTFISRGARIVSEKGILVVNAAGNEGDGRWRYVNPPADIPEVLAVGGVKRDKRHVEFSSYGYPYLEDTKPDVCALASGVAISTNSGRIYGGNGTSYACPIVCGLAAGLLQSNPNAAPYDLIIAIENSADRRLMPDSAYGNGLPNFILANKMLQYVGTDSTLPYGVADLSSRSSSKASQEGKLLLTGPEAVSYKAVLYREKKALFFRTKSFKTKKEGSFLSSGHAVLDVPETLTNTTSRRIKYVIVTKDGKKIKGKSTF